MTSLCALRIADRLILGEEREHPEGAAWITLAEGIEGLHSRPGLRASILWDPSATTEGLYPLSLYEHGEYLCRLPLGARWGERCEGFFSPVSSALGASGLWRMDVRGRSGSAVLQAFLGEQRLFSLPLELRSRKLHDIADWRAMLDALAGLRMDLCIAPQGSPSELSVVPGESSRSPDGSWERFVLLRFLAGSGVVSEALRAIDRSPVSSLERNRRIVPLALSTRARPEDLAASTEATEPSGLPRTVSESRPEPSLDAPENRFVSAVIERLVSDARSIGEDPAASALHPASAALCTYFETLREGSTLLRTVSLKPSSPLHSAALERRAGYRELLGVWRSLLASRPGFAWQNPTGPMEPLRDTPTLYERWCTLCVCQLLRVSELRTTKLMEGAASVTTEILGRAITLSSQRSFTHTSGSYSLSLRPDLCLSVGRRKLLLDAKYQLQTPTEPTGPEPREQIPWEPSGVIKMHAYRDAISGVWGAAVIYPGDEREAQWFSAPDGGGTGAFPLRPGADKATVESQQLALKTLIARFVMECHEL